MKDPTLLAGMYTPAKPPQPDEQPAENNQDFSGEACSAVQKNDAQRESSTPAETGDRASTPSEGQADPVEENAACPSAGSKSLPAGQANADTGPIIAAAKLQDAAQLQKAPAQKDEASFPQANEPDPKIVQGVPVQT